MTKNLIGLATIMVLAGCGNPTSNDANGLALGNEMGANATGNSAVAMMNSTSPTTVDAPTDAAGYLAKAGAGDLFEIESSKAILLKTKNADIKMFAQMMVDAHTQSMEKLKAAAKQDGVSVSPPALGPLQQQMLDEIKAVPADKVDAVYRAHQSKAHTEALALHQAYAAQGDKPALKKAAGEIVPVVQKHIDELAKMPG